MPKRRLSYGEVVVDPNSRLPSAARRVHRRMETSVTASGASRPVSRKKSSDVLIKLSQSCNNHFSNCHKDRSLTGHIDDEEEKIPEQCRIDLDKLRNLLPEIEKKFHPNAHREKVPDAQDVAHLCDFYNSVMQGNYCPYAPHLFHRGTSPNDVLERVIFLFRHIVSPGVISAVETGDVGKIQSPDSIISTITQTIARFLSFMGDASIIPKVLEDLVNLLHDCVFLSDANILQVKINVFAETSTVTSAALDFSVEIDRLDQLWTLHMATIMVLGSFMLDQKQKKLQPHSNATQLARDHSRDYIRTGWVDLHFSIFDRGLRNHFLTTIASSIRAFIMLDDPLPISENLLSHGQMVGATLLNRVLSDWSRLSQSPSVVAEYSLLVAQAIEKSLTCSFPRPSEYASVLRDALQHVVMDPAILAGRPLTPKIAPTVGKLFLLAILNCIDSINRKPGGTRDSLDAMVLMSIHFLLEDEDSNADVATLCLSNGFIAPLLDLLHDIRFANHVSAILLRLLWKISSPQEINAHCMSFLKDQEKGARLKESHMAKENDEKSVQSSQTVAHDQTLHKDLSKKRPKSADKLASPIRALTLASNIRRPAEYILSSTGPGKKSSRKPWTHAFIVTLETSIRAGQRIAQYCAEATSSVTNSRLSESILHDARLVATTLRLTCRIVSRCSDDNVDADTFPFILDVCRLHVEALMTICKMLSNGEGNGMGFSGDIFPQIIVDCALDLHYSVGQLPSTCQHPSFKTIAELIQTSSFLSREWLRHGEFCDAPSQHSFQGLDFPSASSIIDRLSPQVSGSMDTSKGAFSTWRRTLLLRLGSSYTKGDYSSFIPTASLEILHSFPLGARCCWLVSLYPAPNILMDNLYIFGSSPRSSTEQNKEGPHSSVIPLVLSFLPLHLSSSLAAARGETGTVLKALQKILVEFVMPITRTVEPRDDVLCRVLLFTVSWIDTFVSASLATQSSSLSRYDIFKDIQSLAAMYVQPFFGNKQLPSGPEIDMHLKECIHHLLAKIPENHSDHIVRKMRWLCMAKSVNRCSTSDIRKYGCLQASDLRADTPTKMTTSEFRSQSCFMWLVESCFVDKNHDFRQESCQALCHLVLGDNISYLLAHFASEEDYQTLATFSRVITLDQAASQVPYEVEHAAENVASEFFRAVDRLLHTSIGVCDSQLSFTMANSSSAESTTKGCGSDDNKIFMKRSALNFFSWFCTHANLQSLLGKLCYEKAFQRIVRLWAATSLGRDDDFSFSTSRALAFGELSRVCGQPERSQPMWSNDSPEFTALLCSDVLVLSSSSSKKSQFFQLESFIRATISSDLNEVLINNRLLKACQSLVEEFMPSMVAQFVEERSLDLLRAAPAFRQFLNERLRRARKHSSPALLVAGGSNSPDRWKYRSTTVSMNDLDNEAKKLCLDNKILERVLPMLMMGMDRTALSFFNNEVLKGMTYKTLIRSREITILKGLIWELGQEPETSGPARKAIFAAAATRYMEDAIAVSDSEPHRSMAGANVELGKKWVTNNFMYLLVSVVQFKWNARSVRERGRAMMCLHGMLDFLAASDAPQFFPQIMATINSGISDACCDDWISDQERLDARTLQLFAVKSLSKILRLVAEVQIETIALNLTTIVVALIPVVDDDSQAFQPRSDCTEAREVAVSIFTFLTAGDLGRMLASHFNEIPFLPTSKYLGSVHQALLANGVDFDNLAVLSSTSQSQHGLTSRTNVHDTTQASTIAGNSGPNINDKMLALQKRLTLICGMLENESTSVRMVSLGHLTDLLRGNRDTFSKLIMVEGSLAGKRFLTLTYKDDAGNAKWSSRGATASMLEKLVSRCIVESETEVRIRLAACLGEVGAISETILGELKISGSSGDEAMDSPTSSFKWRLEQPPWQAQPVKYELQLVTRHLVIALKAARSTTDQHKIAFAIQQLLHLLNSFGGENGQAGSDSAIKDNKGKMTKWLKENLEQSGQYDLVEPYFSSDFKEKSSDSYATKKPPLFKVSACYFSWMSSFCRWMIQGSKSSDLSPKGWKDLFFACRTAIRTESGLIVAEFIVPLLVLDRICFGTSEERLLLHREFADIFQTKKKVFMGHSDRQKALNMAFMIMDTLRIWSEREVEERSRGRSTATSSRSRRQIADKYPVSAPNSCWSAEDSIARITELLNSIPLRLQAQAADVYGMNALALQRLEIEARDFNVLEVFEKTVEEQKKNTRGGKVSRCHTFNIPMSNDYNIELLKKVLSRLDDCETMAAIGEDALYFDPMQQIRDSIRKQLSLDNYESALEEFERAFQTTMTDRDADMIGGFLRCLMELGRYESVLNHVGGLHWNKGRYESDGTIQDNVSYAVEAAWKLGNWTKLSELLLDNCKGSTIDSSQGSQLALGKAISAFHHRDMLAVESAVRLARENVMQNLCNAAREGYEKSYDDIVTLQVIREIENAKEILILDVRDSKLVLDEIAYSTAMDGWSWKGRVDVVTCRGALAIASPRIALARLECNPMLEASLFLESGIRARKNHRLTMAETLLLQAQAALAPFRGPQPIPNAKLTQLAYSLQLQQAKVKFSSGDCGLALKILGQRTVDESVEAMLPMIDDMSVLEALAADCEKKLVLEWSGLAESCNQDEDGSDVVHRFSTRVLQLTRWSFELGLKGTSEILDRFRLVQKLAPGWEKGHFYFGRFVDNVLQARMTAMVNGVSGRESLNGVDENEIRSEVLLRDSVCQTHILLAMRVYAAALKIDTKHVFQALPRLLSLWFDLVSVAREQVNESGSKQDQLQMLRHHQNQANTFMATQVRDIPPIAFYTAMPQLIARVIHDDPETSMVVRSILQRVLVKFPQQAMWPLAWLQGSKIPDRAKIGEQIFQGAEKALAKNHKYMSILVKVCKNLFEYLRNLAVYDPGNSERSNILNLRPWQHPEVDLSDFLPPIQAALAITPSTIDHATAKDHFTRTIPRMRAFSSRVGVMASKAKPKKLRAYAVPGSYKAQRIGAASSAKSRSSDEIDIGELHFLVKQEAKGDLRKDARVQDLNNVINRLMSSNTGESGALSRRRRRLHLRTFAVTCLSEDIGILEWVPDTDSLRNLVSKSYNPQTSAACIRRRGSRLANFGDATLRSNYEMCQNKFFKEGNLAKAACMFEDQCLRPFPPLLYWWFIQKFHSPHAWYEARNRFTLSAAAWSAVGHVIGLGDRHSENILVDTSSGECVHVDFDCIFDKGLNLPRPEVVPFRLTANMLDAFGPSGADGVYAAGLQTAMRTLRDNRDTLLSVLEPFLKDPVIDWKRHRGQQKAQSGTTMAVHTDKQAEEAKRSIKVIDERLQGIYNLRNPNLKKYRRRDQSTDQDDEFGHLVPLPVEGQVQRMIQEATSSENLVQLYVGWMPWV